ncbi:hypothetical protein [Erwinia sorbitola]|uniref:hypothetical protein n=1 Tax=Erwinia sorbitola TaxID=2681984 RepID=UPI001E601830|nr:hypothetical protein [Erwinia sorbitola]
MPEARKVANRILEVLKGRRKQSVYIRYTSKVGEVVLDFSNDLSALLWGYFDVDNRHRNQIDTLRLMHRLKRGVSNSDMSNILNMVLKRFLNDIKENKEKHTTENIGKTTGKLFLNAALINDLSSIFSKKFVGKMSVSFLISTIFSIGGSASRAVYASEKLKHTNYGLYINLRNAGDLDLFYFLVDAYAGPFIDAMVLKQKNQMFGTRSY